MYISNKYLNIDITPPIEKLGPSMLFYTLKIIVPTSNSVHICSHCPSLGNPFGFHTITFQIVIIEIPGMDQPLQVSSSSHPRRQIMESPFLGLFCLPPLFTRDVTRPSVALVFHSISFIYIVFN